MTKSKYSESRKIRKPLMERKRRARINESLNKIKEILLQADAVPNDKEGNRPTKLEKADILELTISYILGSLQQQQNFEKNQNSITHQVQINTTMSNKRFDLEDSHNSNDSIISSCSTSTKENFDSNSAHLNQIQYNYGFSNRITDLHQGKSSNLIPDNNNNSIDHSNLILVDKQVPYDCNSKIIQCNIMKPQSKVSLVQSNIFEHTFFKNIQCTKGLLNQQYLLKISSNMCTKNGIWRPW